jgi:hypothetical protein
VKGLAPGLTSRDGRRGARSWGGVIDTRSTRQTRGTFRHLGSFAPLVHYLSVAFLGYFIVFFFAIEFKRVLVANWLKNGDGHSCSLEHDGVPL